MSHTTNTPPDHPSPLLRIITLIFSSFFLFTTILTSILVICIRYVPSLFNNPLSLRARAPILQLFSVWGLCLQIIAWCFVASVPGMNCASLMILSNIGWYSFLVSILLRGWRLYYIFHWNAREIKELIKRERMEKKRLRSREQHAALLSKQQQRELRGEISSKRTHPDSVADNDNLLPGTETTASSTASRKRVALPVAMESAIVNGGRGVLSAATSGSANLLRKGTSFLVRGNDGNRGSVHSHSNGAANSTALCEVEEKSHTRSSVTLVNKTINTNTSAIATQTEMPSRSMSTAIAADSTAKDQSTNPAQPTPKYNRPSSTSPIKGVDAVSDTSLSLVHNDAPPISQRKQSEEASILVDNPEQSTPSLSVEEESTLEQPTTTTTSIATNVPPFSHADKSPSSINLPPQTSPSTQRSVAATQINTIGGQTPLTGSGGIFSRIRNTVPSSVSSQLPTSESHLHPAFSQQPQYITNQSYFPSVSVTSHSATMTHQQYIHPRIGPSLYPSGSQPEEEDYLFGEGAQNYAPFPASSPLQSFSLLTTHSADSYHQHIAGTAGRLSSHPSRGHQPPLSPSAVSEYMQRHAAFTDALPSMGHLNLTYHDQSSSHRHNGGRLGLEAMAHAGVQLYDGVSPTVPLEQRGFLHSPENNDDFTARDVPEESDALSGSGELISDWMEILQLHVKESTTNINKRRANEKNLLIFFFIGLIPTLLFLVPITLFMPRFFIPHSFLCDINTYTYPTTELQPRNPNQFPIFEFIFSLISVFLMLIGVFKLMRVRDTYHLNTELRVMGLLIMFGALLYGLVIPFASHIIVVPLSLFFTWYSMLMIPLIYYPYLYILRFWGRKISRWYRRKRYPDSVVQEEKSPALRGIGDSSPPFNPNSLNSILQNLTLRDMLKKHMVHSLCSELITFYEHVTFYKSAYDENFPESSINLASDIVDTYITEECPKPIHLPKQVRNDIIHEITDAVDSVPLSIFDDASKYVVNTIRKDGTFSSFKRSRKFRKYLKQEKEKKIEEVIERAGGLLGDDDK